MKKSSFLLVMVMLAGILLFAGCSGQAGNEKKTDETAAGAFPVTVTDGMGDDITIQDEPKKIVSLIPSNTEILYELGLGNQVVGVSDFDNYPEEVLEKEKIGGVEFNIEKIISLTPDLVLAHASTADTMKDGIQQIRDAGIDVVTVNDAADIKGIFDSIDLIGKSTGAEAKAEEIIDSMKERLNLIKEKADTISEAEKRTVFVEVSPAPDLYTPGKDTFMNELLETINAENIITESGWLPIDEEAVIERNPDVIISTHGYYTENAVQSIMGRPGWSSITAVKNKQVVDVNSDIVTRTGPRIVEGVEELAEAVYPDVFSE